MKMDITLAVPGLPFNGKTFDQQSLGGSETAGYYVARALAKRGHGVTVFCNTEPMRCDDVDYMPISMFPKYIEVTTHDVCIVQRVPQFYSQPCQARFSALWCHDLAVGRDSDMVRGLSWNYDKVFVLSEFMKEQYRTVHGFDDGLMFQTRNGVDLELVERVKRATRVKALRNPLSLVYGARSERGLDVMLTEIMPRILRYEPNARLFITGYNNPTPELNEFNAMCTAAAAKLGNSVVQLGALTKEQLYEVYCASGVYVYPLPSKIAPDFDEISCISFMEAQACGLPVIGSARGALPETLAKDAGILISEPAHTEAYYEAFANATLRYMRDSAAAASASRAGEERAKTLGWDDVALQWSELFETEIRARSTNMRSLATHFYRRSDIFAAKRCLEQLPADDVATQYVRERIAEDWDFMEKPDGYREQYEKIGGTHDAAVINWAPHEPRYQALLAWLAQRSDTVKTALDYGCAHGAYAINLLTQLPGLKITGVDIDSHGIEMAYTFAREKNVMEQWRGVVGDLDRLGDATLPEMIEQYDVVIAQEVLEHVPDPGALLKALEARVKDGGWVYITVPFGPWEYSDYKKYPFRAHVSEFDLHDLRDIIERPKGPQVNSSIQALSFGASPETMESLGWWVVQYQVTPETRGKLGEIDWVRKLWCQRQRQTVSAAIIAGPNSEETLHWCLRSLEHVADEVVIADCGLSAEAHRAINSYRWRPFDRQASIAEQREQRQFLNIRVIPGVDPKQHGFETPRNLALDACTQDWVLWIDTDEKVLQPEALTKYLRPNHFQGYSIRQHHFAVDTNFESDMPVRLFRNNKKLRFYGMIHEHPEEGINKGPGRTIVISDVHIPHVGYLIESGRRARFTRNFPMLQADIQKYPERLLQKHFIMRDHMLICTHELQHNGQRVTEEMKQRCREVIALYRAHFLGKGHVSNVDPITYYSQANTILGQGFDSYIQISSDKFDAKPNGVLKARFASTEDMVTEVSHRARDSAQRFESRYF